MLRMHAHTYLVLDEGESPRQQLSVLVDVLRTLHELRVSSEVGHGRGGTSEGLVDQASPEEAEIRDKR